MHDQIDAKAVSQFALTFPGETAPDGHHRRAVRGHGPGRSPVIATDDNRAHPVIQIAERHPLYLFGIGGRCLYPQIAPAVSSGEILQQIERAGQHVIRR